MNVPTLEQRLNATLDVLCGPQGTRAPSSRVGDWIEDSLALLDFMLAVEDEFQIEFPGTVEIDLDKSLEEVIYLVEKEMQ